MEEHYAMIFFMKAISKYVTSTHFYGAQNHNNLETLNAVSLRYFVHVSDKIHYSMGVAKFVVIPVNREKQTLSYFIMILKLKGKYMFP